MSDIRTLVDAYTKAAHTAGANGDGTATLHIDPEAGVKAVVAHLQEWMVVQASNAESFDVDDLHGLFQLILWSNAKPRPVTWVGGEAVPGGTVCQSAEQAVPETTTNDAQRD